MKNETVTIALLASITFLFAGCKGETEKYFACRGTIAETHWGKDIVTQEYSVPDSLSLKIERSNIDIVPPTELMIAQVLTHGPKGDLDIDVGYHFSICEHRNRRYTFNNMLCNRENVTSVYKGLPEEIFKKQVLNWDAYYGEFNEVTGVLLISHRREKSQIDTDSSQSGRYECHSATK